MLEGECIKWHAHDNSSCFDTHDGSTSPHGGIREMIADIEMQNIALVCSDEWAGEGASLDSATSKSIRSYIYVRDWYINENICSSN